MRAFKTSPYDSQICDRLFDLIHWYGKPQINHFFNGSSLIQPDLEMHLSNLVITYGYVSVLNNWNLVFNKYE